MITILCGNPVSKSTSETNENPKIPKWLDKIVLKYLEKNPSDRYQETGYL
jgi:hypothetical protein